MATREYTEEEVRELLLGHISNLVDYWLNDSRAESTEAKMEGLAFSILSALDGSSMALPGFLVAPLPCEEDKEFHREQGENWFPENHEVADQVKADLGGSLHEFWHKAREKNKAA